MTLPTDPWGLTPREREVAGLLFELDTNKAIARHLGTSIRTVEIQVLVLRAKMQARSRVQAAVLWDRWAREQQKEAA